MKHGFWDPEVGFRAVPCFQRRVEPLTTEGAEKPRFVL